MNSSCLRGGSTDDGRPGFSLAELLVLLGVVGTLFSLSLPAFMTYYKSAQVRAAASVIAAYLNEGRQLAIQLNERVCVHITSTAVHFTLGSCAGTVWVGPGTDAKGNIPAPEGIALTATADPVFNNLGAAAPAATVTVAHGTASLSVIVSASGRVIIGR